MNGELAKQIAEALEKGCTLSRELGETRATLVVNFGEHPDSRRHLGIAIPPYEYTPKFLVAVLDALSSRVEAAESLAEKRGEEIARLREELVATNAMLHNTCTAEASVQAERDEAKAAAERQREALTPLAGLTQGMHQFLAACRNQGLFDGDDGELRRLADDWIGEMEEQHYAIGAALADDAKAAGGDPPHEPREEKAP